MSLESPLNVLDAGTGRRPCGTPHPNNSIDSLAFGVCVMCIRERFGT